jgi:Tol biopolymer transport system component/DNA-binding winged helix-turn-helix (wHTH) protein
MVFAFPAPSRTLQNGFRVGESYHVEPLLNSVTGPAGTTRLESKVMQVLLCLAAHAGQVVPKERLMQTVWPDTFVGDDVLTRAISELRRVFGDDAKEPRVIQTIPKSGYRLIAPVEKGLDNQDVRQQPDKQSEQIRTESAESGSAARSRRGWQHSSFLKWSALAVALTIGAALSLEVVRLWPSPRGVMRTTPLTSLPGQERHPSFSPDGNQIAVAWDGENADNQDIYVKVIGEGVPLRVTTNPSADRTPAWSPDGRYIAFVRSAEKEAGLFVIPALGGHERKVGSLTPPHEWPAGPSWSPDGRLLVLHDRSGPEAALSIFVFSIENLERRKLTSPSPNAVGDIAPTISPDGRTVAFNRISVAGGIYVVPLAGGEPKRVTLEQDWRIERLAWSPDGRELVFSASGGAAESSGNLWKVSASGGTPERLTVGGDDAGNPAISTHRNRLAYEQRRQDANIWRIAVPTSRQPTPSPAKLIASTRHEAGPQFSLDGARIAFHSDRSGTFEIWICDAAGSGLVQLTSFGGPVVGAPRWSPDGRRIAFEVLAKGHSDIHVVNVDGGLPERVTSEPSDDVVPSWSNDGRWIYFASNRTGRHEVWKVPAIGGSAVQVTKRGGFGAVESNDGQFVYYSKGFNVDGLWKVAVNGGEEVQVLDFPKAGFWGYWALVETGIYFVNSVSVRHAALQFLSFARRGVVPVATLDGNPVPYEPGIAVSPDGRWILYTQEDNRSSDIMLVENFR